MKKISNRTKQYIQDYTKHCSNELVSVMDATGKHQNIYREWLTVEDAESACMIEREETLRSILRFIRKNANSYTFDMNDVVYFINQKLNTK